MDKSFVTFGKYKDLEVLKEITQILDEQNIAYQIEDDSPIIDASLSHSELSKEYRLKLKQEDFERVNKLLEEAAQKQIDMVDRDYYLFEFSDEELMEIISKPDNWVRFDYLLAQKLLKDRGKEIKPEIAQQLKKQRIRDLAKSKDNHSLWIKAGYLFALLGGIIGLFIGLIIATHKKILPNGKRTYAFTQKERTQGWIIFIISTIIFTISLLLKLLQ